MSTTSSPPATTCPVCLHDIEVPAPYVGKNWRCPDCRTRIVPRVGAFAQAISEGNVISGRARALGLTGGDALYFATVAALLAALAILIR